MRLRIGVHIHYINLVVVKPIFIVISQKHTRTNMSVLSNVTPHILHFILPSWKVILVLVKTYSDMMRATTGCLPQKLEDRVTKIQEAGRRY